MALVLSNGAIFLHIPKTGGNWVRQVLEDQGLLAGELGHKHCDIDRVLYDPYLTANVRDHKKWQKSGQPPIYEHPFTFCFVRHPLSWYESWFRYMTKRKWNDWPLRKGPYDWHPCHELNTTASDNFSEFIKKVLEYTPGYLTRMVSWYTKRGVSYIGKQESLAEDMIKVLSMMNLDCDTQTIRNQARVNISTDASISSDWDPTLRDALLTSESAYIQQFGYSHASKS